MCEALNLSSQVPISDVSEFLLILGLFLIFLIALYGAAFCVVKCSLFCKVFTFLEISL